MASVIQPDTANKAAITANPRYAGLRPWKPGESGNLSGRPKCRILSDALREIYADPEECRKFALALAKKANAGSLPHMQEVLNRLEGRVDASDETSGGAVFNITISAPRPSRNVLGPIVEAVMAESNDSGVDDTH